MEYSKFSVKELKSILDKKGFKGYSKYRKDELINLLSQMKDIEEEEKENEVIKNDTVQEEKEIIEEITDEDNTLKQEEKIEIPPLPPKIEEVKKKEGVINSSDPAGFLQHVKSGISNLTPDKKSDILKSIVEYKTVQKLQEHKKLQDEFNKLNLRCDYLQEEINYLKSYTKEVRESFLMSMMIIMHNFSFLPLEKLPIFKKK
jgi:hypothetical protein